MAALVVGELPEGHPARLQRRLGTPRRAEMILSVRSAWELWSSPNSSSKLDLCS